VPKPLKLSDFLSTAAVLEFETKTLALQTLAPILGFQLPFLDQGSLAEKVLRLA
jgi:hypothetical protein